MKRMHQEKFSQSWGLYQKMFEETDIGEQQLGAKTKHATLRQRRAKRLRPKMGRRKRSEGQPRR